MPIERYPEPDTEEYAGVLDRRLEALLLDGLLVGAVVVALVFGLGALVASSPLGGVALAAVGVQFGFPLVFLGYQIVFEGYYGRTLGKAARGIVVVQSDGSEMTWGASVIRNVLRIVDALPVFYLIGVIAAYASDDHQRVGDMAADTVVCHVA